MEQFLAVTGRNLKLYFRDRGAVFFSLLSMIIVICLMVFFLGDMNIEDTAGLFGGFPGRDAAADKKNAELLILAWTCAGILSINAVTVTLSCYAVMIRDRVSGKLNAIYTAPIRRGIITAGYIAAAWLASVIICTITLVITEAYLVAQGAALYSAGENVQLMGMIFVNSFAYASIMYFVAMLARTEGAWSGLGTVVGTLVGFLGGIYIPIGTLSEVIGNVMKCTPIIYGTAMFRNIMTKHIMDGLFVDVPGELTDEYRLVMGIDLDVFDRLIGIREEWIVLFFCGMIFLVVGIAMLRYGRRTDR